jgi:hypothetical protein
MSQIARILAVLLLMLTLPPSAAAIDEVFQTAEGAIRGYDPVAYHLENRAVRGRADFTHDWNGARWRFASAANRDRFAAEPARFAPQFGGYCAYGTAQGYKVSTDPEAFAVVDGRLYLNYSKAVQATWNRDRPGYIAAAERQWTVLAATPYTGE